MIAADSLALLERNAQLHRRILVIAGILAAAAILLLTGYCTGGRRTRTGLAIAAIHAKQDTIRDTIRVVEYRLATRAPQIARADTQAATARRAHDKAASRITVIDSNTVSIDDGPAVHEVPANLVVPGIQTCSAMMTADTIDTNLIRAQLVDMTSDRDAQRDRADGDEAEMKILKPRTFGFKSGLATGLALMIGLAHFVR